MKVKITILALLLLAASLLACAHVQGGGSEGDSATKIRGSLTYPSERIPDSVRVCAQNVASLEDICSDNQIESDEFIYGVGYELELASGDYKIYAKDGSTKAFHNAYVGDLVVNGEWSDYSNFACEELNPIAIATDEYSGEDIAVGDWYYDQNCLAN